MSSELIVDELTGRASAGSIAVTAEGGTVTTNLQQGLAKAWVNNTNAAVITDSFNVASGIDRGTGTYDITFTNAMANATYSPAVATLHALVPSIGQESGDITTTFYQVIVFSRNNSLTLTDQQAFSQIFGDLA